MIMYIQFWVVIQLNFYELLLEVGQNYSIVYQKVTLSGLLIQTTSMVYSVYQIKHIYIHLMVKEWKVL